MTVVCQCCGIQRHRYRSRCLEAAVIDYQRDGKYKQVVFGSTIIPPATFDLKLKAVKAVCSHTRLLTPVVSYRMHGYPPLTAHQGCAANEVDGVLRRHVVPLLHVAAQGWAALQFVAAAWIAKHPFCVPLTDQQLIASRPPRMRKRYGKALQFLGQVTAVGAAFVKWEPVEPDAGKAPRLIQYRNAPFTVQLAKYVVAYDKFLSEPYPDNHGFPITVKGLNAQERAITLRRAYETPIDDVGQTRIFLADHSRFDSRVGPKHLALEHECYNSAFNCQQLRTLLLGQCSNTFYTRAGLKYQFPYRRCSGDANTSTGNCLINYFILRAVFGPNAIIFVDGDDSVVFSTNAPQMGFDAVGMETTVEEVHDFQEIEFCQAKPMLTPKGWVMMRNPVRAVRRYQLSRTANLTKDYLLSIGIGEGQTSSYCPIVWALSKKYRSMGQGGRYRRDLLSHRVKVQAWDRVCSGPTPSTRAQCAQLWGIMPHEQEALERAILAARPVHECWRARKITR